MDLGKNPNSLGPLFLLWLFNRLSFTIGGRRVAGWANQTNGQRLPLTAQSVVVVFAVVVVLLLLTAQSSITRGWGLCALKDLFQSAALSDKPTSLALAIWGISDTRAQHTKISFFGPNSAFITLSPWGKSRSIIIWGKKSHTRCQCQLRRFSKLSWPLNPSTTVRSTLADETTAKLLPLWPQSHFLTLFLFYKLGSA